jgi:hypothetical protein
MKKIFLSVVAGASFAIAIAACSGSSGSKAPSFADPNPSAPQIDRMGRPAINTIVKKVADTTGASSDAFNGATPDVDVASFSAALGGIVALAHACPSAAVAGALLPDVLTLNTGAPTTYATLNGRNVNDDVFDQTLAAIYSTNGGASYCIGGTGGSAIFTDHISANDVTNTTTFPYVANPH